MRIAIIGAGNVGGGLGKAFSDVGHEVVFGVRDPDSTKTLTALADIPAATAAEPSEAVDGADVIVFAIRPVAIPAMVADLPPLDDRIVIDAMNRFDDDPTRSTIQDLADRLPGAKLAKAFNTIGFENLSTARDRQVPAAMFVAADDEDAKRVAMQLASEIGFVPEDAGGLANAKARLPSTTTLSITSDVAPNITLSADVQYSHWSLFKDVTILSANPPFPNVQGYRDAWMVAVGGIYRLSPRLALKAGIAFDQTPVTSRYRAVALPDTDRYLLGMGAEVRLTDSMTVEGAYGHSFAFNNPNMNTSINNTDPITHSVTLNGRYDINVDIVALTFRYAWRDRTLGWVESASVSIQRRPCRGAGSFWPTLGSASPRRRCSASEAVRGRNPRYCRRGGAPPRTWRPTSLGSGTTWRCQQAACTQLSTRCWACWRQRPAACSRG